MNYAVAWSVTWHIVVVACAYAAYAAIAFPAISLAQKINGWFEKKPTNLFKEWFGFVLSIFAMTLIVIPGLLGIVLCVAWLFK